MASGGPCKEMVTLTIQTYENRLVLRPRARFICSVLTQKENRLQRNKHSSQFPHFLLRSDHVHHTLPWCAVRCVISNMGRRQAYLRNLLPYTLGLSGCACHRNVGRLLSCQ